MTESQIERSDGGGLGGRGREGTRVRGALEKLLQGRRESLESIR